MAKIGTPISCALHYVMNFPFTCFPRELELCSLHGGKHIQGATRCFLDWKPSGLGVVM